MEFLLLAHLMMRTYVIFIALLLAPVGFLPVASAGCAGDDAATVCSGHEEYHDVAPCGVPVSWGSYGESSSLTIQTLVANAAIYSSEFCYTWDGSGFGLYSLSAGADANDQWVGADLSRDTEWRAGEEPTSRCTVNAWGWGDVTFYESHAVPEPVCGALPNLHVPDLLP